MISIHALLAESDSVFIIIFNASCSFLSTLSLRRATRRSATCFCPSLYFYPRSPCGERPASGRLTSVNSVFLSTLSLRRATTPVMRAPAEYFISIHALLAESDRLSRTRFKRKQNFYPRSPCGERHIPRSAVPHTRKFLSTLSLRRATCRGTRHALFRRYFYPRSPCGERPGDVLTVSTGYGISIHALLAESDSRPPVIFQTGDGFLSTLSLRRAT